MLCVTPLVTYSMQHALPLAPRLTIYVLQLLLEYLHKCTPVVPF
jgi:hypothetical protein